MTLYFPTLCSCRHGLDAHRLPPRCRRSQKLRRGYLTVRTRSARMCRRGSLGSSSLSLSSSYVKKTKKRKRQFQLNIKRLRNNRQLQLRVSSTLKPKPWNACHRRGNPGHHKTRCKFPDRLICVSLFFSLSQSNTHVSPLGSRGCRPLA